MEECETPSSGTSKPVLQRTGTKILEDESEKPKQIQKRKSAVLARYPSYLLKHRKPISEIAGPNDWLEVYLPHDILLWIFMMLSRKELVMASKVCKYWRSVSQDPYFGWAKIAYIPINIRNWLGRDLPEDATLRMHQWSGYEVWSGNQKLCEAADVLPGLRWKKLYPIQTAKRAQMEALIKAYEANSKMYRQNVALRVADGQQGRFIMEIHVHSFESLIRRGEPVRGLDLIMKRVREEQDEVTAARLQKMIGNKSANIPMKSDIPSKQPANLREGLNLYKYQLDAVSWMKSVEDDISANVPYKYTPLVPWRSGRSEILFDFEKNSTVTYEKIGEHTKSFYPKGAILADEMGLGKTIEMLGLILSNPPTLEEEAESRADNTASDEKETADSQAKLFKSNATVVICPNHLAMQWNQELYNNSEPHLKILRFTTMAELYASSYEEISQADVVVVSFQLLKNGNYLKVGTSRQSISVKDRSTWVNNHLKKVRKLMQENAVLKDPPLLEHFQWHRVIVDEAHEVMAEDFYQETFAMYKAKYYWYVSGTPFPNEETLGGILEFLEFPWSPDAPSYLKLPFADILWNNLYWRNTKESVKDEYTIPNIVEDVVVLEFTDIENVVYQDSSEDDKRKLCSSIPGSTLTAVKAERIGQKKDSIRQYKQQIAECKDKKKTFTAKLAKLKLKLQNNNKPEDREKLNIKIRDAEYQLTSAEHHLIVSERNLELNQKLLEQYEATKSFEERLEKTKILNRAASTFRAPYAPSPIKLSSNNNNNNQKDEQEDVQEPSKGKKKGEKNLQKSKRMEVEEENEKDEEDSGLTEQQMNKMTVAQLKAELAKKNIAPKKLKADLIKQLKEVMQNEPVTESKKRKQKDVPKEEEAEVKKHKTEAEVPKQEMEVELPKAVEFEKPAEVKPVKSRLEAAIELAHQTERLGTKMANLIGYLNRLWDRKPQARVIIFSQFDSVLHSLNNLLEDNGIPSVFLQGTVISKNKALTAFKAKDSKVRVMLLSLDKSASGTNLIEASHVILMDPITGTKQEAQAAESQAIGRAYRQGQTQQVTIVRFLIKGTIEHQLYIKNYLQEEEEKQQKNREISALHKAVSMVNKEKLLRSPSAKPHMFRSSSVSTLLANSFTQSASTVVELIEQAEPKPQEDDTENVQVGEVANENQNQQDSGSDEHEDK